MEDKYKNILYELKQIIPKEEQELVLNQEGCEYDFEFWGFLNIYKPISEIIPERMTVVDFGCYLAPQSYLFKNHKKYIGVDFVNLKRFTPKNAQHYVCAIQDFISQKLYEVYEKDNGKIFAICSYVPDFDAVKLVKETFPNCFCYYPS